MKGNSDLPFCITQDLLLALKVKAVKSSIQLPRGAVDSIRVFTLSIGRTGSSSHGLLK